METTGQVISFPGRNLKGFSFIQLQIDELLRSRVLRDAGTERTAAWLRLLCAGFHGDIPGSLPKDENLLAEAASLYADEWATIRDSVMREWYLDENGRWRTPILDRVVRTAQQRQRGNQNGGDIRAEQQKAVA